MDRHQRPETDRESELNEPDTDLLRRARQGEASAYHDMVSRYAPGLYRLGVSMLGNTTDAEDVVQETFAAALRGIDRFEGRSSIRTWLTGILVNQVARCRRRHARKGAASLELMDRPPPVADPAEATDRRIDLLSIVDRLPPEQRDVILLREFEQLDYREIAELLGVPAGTVDSRLYRARQALKELLKDYLS